MNRKDNYMYMKTGAAGNKEFQNTFFSEVKVNMDDC